MLQIRTPLAVVDCVWKVMVHAQKQDFVFRRNGRVHLNRRGRQFSRLLAAEVCASAVVMLHTPGSEVVWRVLTTHSIRQFALHFPPPPCVTVCHPLSTGPYMIFFLLPTHEIPAFISFCPSSSCLIYFPFVQINYSESRYIFLISFFLQYYFFICRHPIKPFVIIRKNFFNTPYINK
jgi:hypothetical protein